MRIRRSLFYFKLIFILLLFSLFFQLQTFGQEKKSKHRVFLSFQFYSTDEHIYYQFTGEENFKTGLTADNFISGNAFLGQDPYSLSYEYGIPLTVDGLKEVSFGWESSVFTSSTETTVGADNYTKNVNSEVNMILHIESFNVKLHFGRNKQQNVSILDSMSGYFAIGWGWMYGSLSGYNISNSNQSFHTTFAGPYTSREFGIMLFGENITFNIGLRFVTANKTETGGDDPDPFTQNNGRSFDLDFTGSGLSIGIGYMF
ncbi:MAG: hypothetical protein ACI86H_001795 [bacterium]|jgi:hypothetical protein